MMACPTHVNRASKHLVTAHLHEMPGCPICSADHDVLLLRKHTGVMQCWMVCVALNASSDVDGLLPLRTLTGGQRRAQCLQLGPVREIRFDALALCTNGDRNPCFTHSTHSMCSPCWATDSSALVCMPDCRELHHMAGRVLHGVQLKWWIMEIVKGKLSHWSGCQYGTQLPAGAGCP
jgi:hypothetical protein